MSIEENKALVRRVWEEIWNKGNIEVIDEVIANDYVFHMTDTLELKGPEWYKGAYHFLTNAFPDLHCTIEDMITEGDRVMIRNTVQGTHKGEYMGAAPTGRQFSVTEIAVIRIKDGKLVEEWGGMNRLDLLQQLGVIPTQ